MIGFYRGPGVLQSDSFMMEGEEVGCGVFRVSCTLYWQSITRCLCNLPCCCSWLCLLPCFLDFTDNGDL